MNKRNFLKGLSAALVMVTVSAGSLFAGPIAVDVNLNDYVKVQGVAGNLNSVGSDTLNNMMTLWAEGFRKKYPNVNVQIEGKGSSTAPPALIEGTSQIGPMSREMKETEIIAFETKYGFKPTTIGVALDALAVFVNKDNPVKEMSMTQVDSVFSKTLKRGGKEAIVWGDLAQSGQWANQPISLYGRNSASGTYGYFKETSLKNGDFKNTVKEQPGNASVVLGVTEDKAGIGYSGMGYVTSGVKALPLSAKDGEKAYEPNYANVLSGNYPLGRMLYVNVIKEPNKPMPTLVKEFLKFVLSEEGQEIVVKDGFLPLPAEIAAKQLSLLD
jgi:phosphate transport system substrate-binding protein